MNTYKCQQCGLVNWATAESCKRCGQLISIQNEFSAPAAAQNTYTPNNEFSAPVYNTAMPPANFSSPPPPNIYGQESGTAYGGFPNAYPYQHAYQYQLPPQVEEELKQAENKIKKGWTAGIVVSGLGIFAGILLMAVGKVDAGFFAGTIFTVSVFGGLSFGIYKKSRACAIILLTYYLIDKIATILYLGNPAGIIWGVIFTIFFVYGIQGTFAYQKLKQQYPNHIK